MLSGVAGGYIALTYDEGDSRSGTGPFPTFQLMARGVSRISAGAGGPIWIGSGGKIAAAGRCLKGGDKALCKGAHRHQKDCTLFYVTFACSGNVAGWLAADPSLGKGRRDTPNWRKCTLGNFNSVFPAAGPALAARSGEKRRGLQNSLLTPSGRKARI